MCKIRVASHSGRIGGALPHIVTGMNENITVITPNFVENLKVAKLAESKELSLNGGGQSLFYKDNVFLICSVQTKEYSWSKTMSGKAFVTLCDGDIEMCGAGRLNGGMGYKTKPKTGSWTKTENKETGWKGFYYSPNDDEQLETIQYGIGRLIKHWLKDSKPLGCVVVKVTDVTYCYGAQPVKEGEAKPAGGAAAIWTKSVVAWAGEAHYATAAEVTSFVKDYEDKNPGNPIPETWKKVYVDTTAATTKNWK